MLYKKKTAISPIFPCSKIANIFVTSNQFKLKSHPVRKVLKRAVN